MRIGVIGAGVIGKLRIQSIGENPATELAAVMDPAAEVGRRAAGNKVPAFTELERFLDVEMNAAVVSSPVHVHEAACLGAFERGLHVLCEKPLSNTVDSCRRIVDAAVRANRVLGVGFNLRYYPAISFVRDTLDQGTIGELDHLRIFGGHEGLPKFRSEWEYKAPESGGGAMMDVGLHMTDLARYFLGEITEVYGVESGSVWDVAGSEDNALAVFRNPDGIPAVYQATWTEWRGYRFYVEAYGNLGMVRGFYAPMRNLLITQARPGAARRKKRLLYPEIMLREKLGTWTTTALRSFREELSDFLAMVDGDSDVRGADGYAGLRSVEVAAAVRESTRTREAVHLAPLGRMSR
jgi:predicted dehydrogenase